MKRQTREQKLGEIRYRERLVEQQVLGIYRCFDDHPLRMQDLVQDWINPQLDDLRRVISSLDINKSVKILEIGCENGHCSSFLADQGYFAVGIDISMATLRFGVPAVSSELGFQTVPFLTNGDIVSLPFRSESFDVVFCFSCLHHFPGLDEPIVEIHRVLREGGKFFCSWEPLKSLAHSFKFLYDRVRKTPSPTEVGYNIHEGRYTYFQWISPLERGGFEIEQINTQVKWLPHTGFGPVDRFFAFLAGFSVEIICRKKNGLERTD
jgi:SAM-dependent methyltransferase